MEVLFDVLVRTNREVKVNNEIWAESIGMLVRSIYASTNSEPEHCQLRKTVVQGCWSCILVGYPRDALETAIKNEGEFAYDMFNVMEEYRTREE